MSSFHVAGRQVKAAYKHRNLRAATCHVPDARDTGGEAVSTKVRVAAATAAIAAAVCGAQHQLISTLALRTLARAAAVVSCG